MENIIVCTYDEKLLPERKTHGAVCRDLRVAESCTIEAGGFYVAKLGIKTYIPHGWHSKIYARGGLPVKQGLMLANSVGVVDADYRGEYMFQMYNFTQEQVTCEKYTRVGQLEFLPYLLDSGKYGTEKVPNVELIVDSELYEHFEQKYSSERGAGRFHSTGTL